MKKLAFILMIICMSSMAFAIVGHSANQISPGTFGAGNYIFSGIVTAANFSGDGSAVTNVKAPWAEITGMPAGFSDGTDDSDTLWSESGSNIYYNSGNAGIGTTEPDVKLDVESAAGDGAAEIGASTNSATGDYAIAIGKDTLASGYASISTGGSTTASGNYATAMGYNSVASNAYTTAIGLNTVANGSDSTALGRNTVASGGQSTAIGYNTQASGLRSTAIGSNTQASGDYSTAMGQDTTALGGGAVSMGYNTLASGAYSLAKGHSSKAEGTLSTAFGREINVTGTYSFGISLNDPNPHYLVSDSNTMAIMGGKVGIGTVSPGADLHIVNSGSDAWIMDTTGGDKPTHFFQRGTTSASRPILAVNNSNGEVFRVDGDGKVKVNGMAGAGNAYACVDANGNLYRSATACA